MTTNSLDTLFARADYYSVLKARPSKREALDKGTEMCCNSPVNMAGVDDGEVPPVPIPNTEVKLTCADDS